MDELLIRRKIKEVMRYGIPKEMARDIVETASGASKGKNIDLYINYAIDLVYGLGLSKDKKITS